MEEEVKGFKKYIDIHIYSLIIYAGTCERKIIIIRWCTDQRVGELKNMNQKNGSYRNGQIKVSTQKNNIRNNGKEVMKKREDIKEVIIDSREEKQLRK